MEARSEKAVENDIAEEEDLNISNLLVTKSERAPTTEPAPPLGHPLRMEKFRSEVMNAAALVFLGGLGIALAIMLGRRLIARVCAS